MAVMAVMVVVVVWVRSRDSSEGGGAERRGEEKSEWEGEERERGRCGLRPEFWLCGRANLIPWNLLVIPLALYLVLEF